MPDLVATASVELRALRDMAGVTTYLANIDGLDARIVGWSATVRTAVRDPPRLSVSPARAARYDAGSAQLSKAPTQ